MVTWLFEQAGSASPRVGGSLTQIELGGTASPQAGRRGNEVVVVDASQDGQALPSSIEGSQILATEDFSCSTPQASIEDSLHPSGGSTTLTTQPPRPPDLS